MDWFELTVPAPGASQARVADVSGREMTLTVSEAATAVYSLEGGLCVPDVYALARHADDGAVRALCRLAMANRVLCRTVASRLGCDSGSPSEILTYLDDSRAEAAVVTRHGPGGVFAATRGALAPGAASAAGLALDPQAATKAVEFCRGRADGQFRQLMAHPDADRLFKDGRHTTADAKGFRQPRPEPMREWLRDQLVTVADRLRLPVSVPHLETGEVDLQVRHWPAWAVGTGALAALVGLQDAEYLGNAFRSRQAGARVQPKYPAPPDPISTAPDLAAYRRLRGVGLPACFVPASGHTFARVDLGELSLALLGPTQAPILAEELATDTGVTLTVEQMRALVVLAASGASDGTVAVGLGRLAGFGVTKQQAAHLVRALVNRLPALADHLRDPTPGRLARHTGATEGELAKWTGYTQPEPGDEGSMFRRFLESGFTADVLAPDPHDNRVLERFRRCPPCPPEYQPSVIAINLHRSGYAHIERERVRARSGEVIPCATWVQARAAAAVSAHRAVTCVAFALVAAGHRVVAVTPTEVLAEVPADRLDTGAIDRIVAEAVGHFIERCPAPPSEVLDRW